jgi:hypothetical protein
MKKVIDEDEEEKEKEKTNKMLLERNKYFSELFSNIKFHLFLFFLPFVFNNFIGISLSL